MLSQRTADPAAAEHRTESLLTDLFVLRVGGMPVDVALSLRFPETLRWAEDVLDLEADLVDRRDAVGAVLETAVGQTDDQATRRRLLALRRDVFNLRSPRDAGAARDLADRLDPPDRDRLVGWLDARARCDLAAADGAGVLAGELGDRRRRLRALAGDQRLRRGLLLASPSLDRYLPTYLDAPDGPLNKRGRRIERSLLEYVFRTACKTSPFSTFTKVALGRFAEGVGATTSATGVDDPGRSHVRLNVAALVRLAGVVTANPRLCADLPVELTAGWQSDTRRIRYVRRTRQAGDDGAATTFDTLQENLFFLSRGTVLEELIALFGEESPLRMGELVDRLHRVGPDDRDRDEIWTYLDRLLRLSLLTAPVLGLDIHSDDPLRSFAERVGRIDRPWAGQLVDRLGLVAGHLDEYAAADLGGRRRLLDAVRGELTEAQHDLGLDEVTTPRTLLYEDVSLPDAEVVADTGRWRQELMPALDGLMRMLPAFDVTVPHRLALKGFFLARFGAGGRCHDVLRFLHEFHRDFYEQFLKVSGRRVPFDEDGAYVPLPNWLRLPEITALDDARRELATRMLARHAANPGDDHEIVLDDEFVDAVAAALPPTGHVFDPRSFFLQVAERDGRPLGVLNRTYAGLTLLFSRFAHCLPGTGGRDLVPELRQVLSDTQPAGAVFAELTGGYDTTNLNLHPAVTGYELVCPGESSSRPAAAQIPVADLSVGHDEADDRIYLYSERLGAEVIPVYLGFLQPMALPEVQGALLLFSHTSMAQLDLWNGVDPPLRGETIGGHPRVRYRNLVLVRRTWKMHPNYLPRMSASPTESEWFLSWQRWRRANGLPRRVFVTTDTDVPMGDEPAERPGRPQPKPQYVDFDSYFCLTLLDQMAGTATHRVVMQEMLPDVDDLWLRSGAGRYVTEHTVEVVRTDRAGRETR